MKRLSLILLAAAAAFVFTLPLPSQEYEISPVITDWLASKTYEGGTRKYAETDLAAPEAVMEELGKLGVSHFTVLRNEIYARRGYIFKTPVLSAIFSRVSWYGPNPQIGLNALSPLEVKNVNWIKGIEDQYDYEVLSNFLNQREYRGDAELYGDGSIALPLSVELALNHLYINPAQFFRNEIFARHGFLFTAGAYNKILSKTSWYRPLTADDRLIVRKFNDFERVNLALLRERQWVEIVNSVKFSLPEDVTSIPVIGFNALFIKEISHEGLIYHYSWPDAWAAMEEKGKGLDAHVTDIANLVSPAVIDKIKAEPDPKKKIVLFFSNKKYKGYVDKLQFNHSDMDTPEYLAEAIAGLGLDWHLLLRKEIHARNGAKFIDPRVGPIFKACSWYKAKYSLNPRTLTRFPSGIAISPQELKNYSLLEGEELWRRLTEMNALSPESKKACDLLGNFFFIKFETVYITDQRSLQVGHAFPSLDEYNRNSSLQPLFDSLLKTFKFDIDQYRQQEAVDSFIGC